MLGVAREDVLRVKYLGSYGKKTSELKIVCQVRLRGVGATRLQAHLNGVVVLDPTVPETAPLCNVIVASAVTIRLKAGGIKVSCEEGV